MFKNNQMFKLVASQMALMISLEIVPRISTCMKKIYQADSFMRFWYLCQLIIHQPCTQIMYQYLIFFFQVIILISVKYSEPTLQFKSEAANFRSENTKDVNNVGCTVLFATSSGAVHELCLTRIKWQSSSPFAHMNGDVCACAHALPFTSTVWF